MLRALYIACLLFVPYAIGAAAGASPLWEVGVGVAGLSFPDYRGSDQARSYVLPLPYFIYRGRRLRVDRRGVRGLLFSSPRFVLDLSMDGAVPVDSSRNEARVGMADLKPVVEIGPSLDVIIERAPERLVRLRFPVRAVVATDLQSTQREGWTFNPQLAVDWRRVWRVGAAIGPVFATQPYHAYYYSVRPADATPARPAYEARAGYSGMRATLSLSRRFRRYWMGAFVRYDALSGAVFDDSPLVRRDYAVTVGAGIAWIIGRSSRPARRPIAPVHP